MATARLRDTGLTPAQEAFAVFLSLGHSQTDAYKLAYPNQAKGSKRTSLVVNASQLADDANVILRVRQLVDALAIELGMDDKRMLAEYAALLESDARDYFTWSPQGVTIKPSTELTDKQAKAVAGVTERITKDGERIIEVKLHDRTKALTELAERLWPIPKTPEKGGDTYNINITQVTNQIAMLIAEADAMFPGVAEFWQQRVKALGEGQK